MSGQARGIDLEIVCRLVVQHLRDGGVDASARGREIRVTPGLKLRLRHDPGDINGVASPFWVDVDGLHLEPPMRVDVSGWGLSEDDRAIDAAHGILESILPPVRWLAAEPWTPPEPDVGRVLDVDDGRSHGWTIVAGEPWIVVALADGDDGDPNSLVAPLKAAISGTALATLDPVDRILDRVLDTPGGHWIKIFAARTGDEHHGQVDVNNEISIDGASFAAGLPWLDVVGMQIVRQLIVLRPDHELPRQRRRRFGIPFRSG